MNRASLPPVILAVLLLLTAPAYAQSKKPATTKSKSSAASSKGKASATKPASKTSKPAAAKPAPATAPKKLVTPVQQQPPTPPREPLAVPQKAAYRNPFSKGTFSCVNRTNLSYSYLKDAVAKLPTSDFVLGVDVNYFIIDHLAAGIEARVSTHMQQSGGGGSLKFHSWSAYLNLTYGMQITPRINIYARVGGGPGHSYSANSIPSKGLTTDEGMSDSYDLHGTLGLPIALEQENDVFVTPYFTYDYYKPKVEGQEITDHNLYFGLRLESYINCRASRKRGDHGRFAKPEQGVSFFEYNTLGSLSISKRQESQGSIKFGDAKRTTGDIGLGYNVYLIDNLALGLNVDLYSYTFDNAGTIADKTRSWSIEPIITANLPLEGPLNNVFFQIGYGWERESLSANKEHNSYFPLRLGYNLFLAKNICISPKIGYQHNVSEHVTVGGEYKMSGFAAELGIRSWLNFRWFQ